MTRRYLSPSRIACEAVGIEPDTNRLEPVAKATACVACGIPLLAGELASRWAPRGSFTDYSMLANPTGSHLCAHCDVVIMQESDFTQRWLQTIFTAAGCYQTASSDMRAHTLLNPPPPPFVWVMGDQKVQHVVWKTPVTLHHEAMFIRFGERILTIRQSRLAALVALVRRALTEWLAADTAEWQAKVDQEGKRAAGKAPKAYASLFISLDRDYVDFQHALLNPKFRKHAERPQSIASQQACEALENATPGEIWALSAILYAKEPTPARQVAGPCGYRLAKAVEE